MKQQINQEINILSWKAKTKQKLIAVCCTWVLHLLFVLHLSFYICYLLSNSINQISLQNKSLTNLRIIYPLRKPQSTKSIAIMNLTLSSFYISNFLK